MVGEAVDQVADKEGMEREEPGGLGREVDWVVAKVGDLEEEKEEAKVVVEGKAREGRD